MAANGGGDLWLLMTVVGVIALGCGIAYAMIRNRRVTSEQHKLSERATKGVYEAEQRDPANQH